MTDTLSDAGFTQIFNFTLRFGKGSLDIEVPFRISRGNTQAKTPPLHYSLHKNIYVGGICNPDRMSH